MVSRKLLYIKAVLLVSLVIIINTFSFAFYCHSPSMNVTDAWTFLCAAHKQPLEVSASKSQILKLFVKLEDPGVI